MKKSNLIIGAVLAGLGAVSLTMNVKKKGHYIANGILTGIGLTLLGKEATKCDKVKGFCDKHCF